MSGKCSVVFGRSSLVFVRCSLEAFTGAREVLGGVREEFVGVQVFGGVRDVFRRSSLAFVGVGEVLASV